MLSLIGRTARPGEGTLRLEGTASGDASGGAGGHETGSGEPVVTVGVHDPRTFGAVMRHGSVGLAESYMDGWWDTDDLTGAVRIAFRRTRTMRRVLDASARRFGPVPAALKRLRPPNVWHDRRNIAAHYDLSNELFALMLDPSMTYSCAYFEGPETTLEEAQRAKYDRLASKLDLGPRDHVAEIGTGWGGFAVHLAERYGCHVTTTTISEAQRSLAEKRVAEHGLNDRVTVLGADYRQLRGTFDAVVSIEMIEAVDWRRHDEFFATCARLLNGHGRMGLQAITIADGAFERAKLHTDFVRAMVFPGGCLPSLSSMSRSLARTSDLRIVDLEDIGAHYPETLRRWRANLGSHRHEVEELGFDARFWRFWNLYLCYCEAAFMERHVSDVQVVLARPSGRWAARTREPARIWGRPG